MNTRLHAIRDSYGLSPNNIVTAGQISDYICARAFLSSLSDVGWLNADMGYDADWFIEASKDKGVRARITARKHRRTLVRYDKWRYKKCNRIEIMLGIFKNWRSVETHYYHCPEIFLSAIALATLVIYRL